MGEQWLEGSKYAHSHGTVYWGRLANRSATHPLALARAAALRDITHAATDTNDPHVPFPPEIGWGQQANGRVVAWNGGHADF